MNRDALLIVDDMEINRTILRSLFEDSYNILEAANGEQAIMMVNQYHDTIAAMLLDIVMPVKDGYEVMSIMAKTNLLNTVPVIVITAQDSPENEVHSFELGASDMITKPFEPHVVVKRVKNVVELHRHRLHLEELVEEQAEGLRESKEVLMDALSSVIEHRSIESGQHVLRIRMFTKILLEDVMLTYPEYDLDERKIGLISSAAALHDIGKIAIPDAILNKPGRLTTEEFEIMKTHTVKGCEILSKLDRMHDKEYLQYAYHICRYHHERWNGKGYPEGLKGENIPISAQAVSVADAYDALTTDRVYKKAYTSAKAFNMILNGECGVFSPRLLECFKNVRNSFVALTREYADGRLVNTQLQNETFHSTHLTATSGTLELGQMKYFAMLRFENSTVMELDADTGVYHLVHKQNNDFDELISGNLFVESYLAFINKSVHPNDRENIQISEYLSEFLASGAMKKARKYRVLHQATNTYIWYEITVLRINMEDPKVHKVLLIWKEQAQDVQPTAGKRLDLISATQNPLVGLQQCRNDKWFTMLNVEESFVALLGYNREELENKFNNHYIELIYPDDRETVLKQLRNQLNMSNTIELEYRVIAKDGRLVWLLDKGEAFTGEDGSEYFNCALMDITKTKQEQEELRLSIERHRIIMNQTNDIIFEWDIRCNKLYYSPNWVDKFGYSPISEDINLRIPQASHILPEDVPNFVKLMDEVRAGAPYGEVELRIANAQGRYLWNRIRATTQFNSDAKPVKAVGVIVDIDNEKRQIQDLIDKADKDNLTQLYNKNVAWRHIDRYIEQSSKNSVSGMMILDLDNFKQVNDTRGHLFGDAVLVAVASQLKRLFSNDIISRIGGDEFLIFVKELPNKEMIVEHADRLLVCIRNVLTEDLKDSPLIASVGVACFPEDAANFQELFKCCDRALYQAKSSGKNRYVIYDKTSMELPFGLNMQQMAANTRIESDQIYDFDTADMVEQVFRLLYQTGDVENAVYSILEMVGKRYQVSRAYIFEEDKKNKTYSNTFEWCGEGIESVKESLKCVFYDELGDYHANFDEKGIFYCTDISNLPSKQYDILNSQNVCSVLQCAIHDNGVFSGFVGFDDCIKKRMWTQNQINALTFVSELLSTFLLKKRAQDRVEKGAMDLRTLLDTQNSWIYVIDPKTYRLKFINARTYKIAPNAKIGMLCHEAFFNRKEPCEKCPAFGIENLKAQAFEVYNPVLKVWTIADAALFQWEEKEACLLTCHDITSYKMQEKKADEKST